MTIFDDLKRTYLGPSQYSEAHFPYYNRSARAGVISIRATLEEWFTHYPGEHQAALRARFRSGNDRDFDSAFFELFLHELLLRLECRVEVHPDRPTTTGKVPDFYVVCKDESEFFIEAIVATAVSDEEAGKQAVKAVVFDQINKINSPDFFICLPELEGVGAEQPSGKDIRRFLDANLAGLDPDKVHNDYTSGLPFPSWEYVSGGYRMRFQAIPKSAESRQRQGVRALGMLPFEAKWGSDAATVKSAVQKKGGKYGELGIPYVVAVNALSKWGVDHEDVLEALIGTESLQYNVETRETVAIRNRDGAFIGKGGPVYRRVSAVLVAFSLYPASAANAQLHVYHNPWAAHQLSSSLCELPQTLVEDGILKSKSGVDVADLFGFPPEWPGN